MKQFIRSLLLSLLLTGAIGAAFWVFHQGTFFGPAVNWITTTCLILLLAAVWHLFFLNLWFHHMQRKQRVLDALPQPQPPQAEPEPAEPEGEPEAAAEETQPEPEAVPEPEPVSEPEPANRPEATVFIPPQPEEPAKPETKQPAEQWTAAPESTQRPAAKPARTASARSRARRLDEDAARQQKKLEELRAAAARKKAAGAKKRMDWKNSDSQNSEQ